MIDFLGQIETLLLNILSLLKIPDFFMVFSDFVQNSRFFSKFLKSQFFS